MVIEKQIKETLKVGDVFQNPGGGTSTVTDVGADFIQYRRGTSSIKLKFDIMEDVYENFQGKTVSTVDLQEFQPEVFNSRRNGHSCNCTFLFMVFEQCGLTAGGIRGKGVRGNPYKIKFRGSAFRRQKKTDEAQRRSLFGLFRKSE